MNGQFEGSRMRAVVVDADAQDRAGAFCREYPAMEGCCTLEYHTLPPKSAGFFALLEEIAPHLCYVVAAAEDEGFNLEVGQAIRNHFAGHGRGLWHDLPPAKQESSRAAADFIPAMLHMAGISAGEATDAALFKGRLVENAPLLENLARTEHLCWNAFHYAMGYTLMPLEEVEGRAQQGITPVQKDMAALRHAGLVGWDELDALSQRLGALMMRSTLDYKQMDRANVAQIPRTLAIHRLLDEKSGLEAR